MCRKITKHILQKCKEKLRYEDNTLCHNLFNSFQVPLDSLLYEVEITGCNSVDSICPVNISVWESLGPSLHGSGLGQCIWLNGSCLVEVRSRNIYAIQPCNNNVHINIIVKNVFVLFFIVAKKKNDLQHFPHLLEKINILHLFFVFHLSL